MITEEEKALRSACRDLGLNSAGAKPVSRGANTVFRLPESVVARVSHLSHLAVAAKEIDVAQHLAAAGVPAVRPWGSAPRPMVKGQQVITLWDELTSVRPTTLTDVAAALQQLHELTAAHFPGLVEFDPFIHLDDRIDVSTTISAPDQRWLRRRLHQLRGEYDGLEASPEARLIHGDATTTNVIVTDAGPTLLDLEGCSLGPTTWDLTSLATEHHTFGVGTAADWRSACKRYGTDVCAQRDYAILRRIRELRRAVFATAAAADDPQAQRHAEYRIRCLRDQEGRRPWTWPRLS